jgi:hypothetical protein
VLKVRDFGGRENLLQPNNGEREKGKVDDRREGSDALDERADGMITEADQLDILRELRRCVDEGGE